MSIRWLACVFAMTFAFAACSGGDSDGGDDAGAPIADDDTVDDDAGIDDDSATDDDTSDDDAGDDDTFPPLPDDDADDDIDDDTDDDIGDDDSVPVECEASIVREPYLQWVTTDSVRVRWRTDEPGYSMVRWGVDDRAEETILSNDLVRKHEMVITGLDPRTVYPYRVESCGVESTTEDFITAPDDPAEAFTFAVWGDTQDHPDVHEQVAAEAYDWDPDFALHVGDLVGSGWRPGDYDNEFFGPARQFLQSTPFFPAMGNHDGNSPFYFDSFYQPGSWGYYSFTYGNTFFIALNTTWIYIPGSEQYRWFVDQLESEAAQDADWIVAYAHHPPYSEGWVGYDGEPMVRMFLVPLFEEYGVDIYFSGHTHNYERGAKNGVTYIISGGGGGGLDPWARDYEHVEVWAGVHHFTGVTVDGPTIDIEAVDIDGNLVDTYQITK